MFYCYIFLIRDISGMGEKGRSIGWPNLGPLLLFFAPFENILFKNRISLFVELKYLWELPLSSSPVVCEANFPMGFANCRNNCQGTAILHSLHLLKKSYKEYREYPHICHFCYKVSRKYYVSFLCVIYGGKKISLAFIILYSLWKGARAIKLPHCSEPLFSVFFFGF